MQVKMRYLLNDYTNRMDLGAFKTNHALYKQGKTRNMRNINTVQSN